MAKKTSHNKQSPVIKKIKLYKKYNNYDSHQLKTSIGV